MASIRLCPEIVYKVSTETKNVDLIFEKEMDSTETISTVDSTAVSPSVHANKLTASSTGSTSSVQVRLAAGKAEQAFTGADTGDVLTCTAHGYEDNDPVHVIADETNNLPGGLSAATQYYVVGKTADTLQLALISGGDAVAITSDGQGRLAADYTVTVTVSTDSNQTLIGKGSVRVRD